MLANATIGAATEIDSDKHKSGYDYHGGDTAILLIHGYASYPYDFAPLTPHLEEKGFSYNAILLPGHGTSPEDLLNVTHDTWQAKVAEEYLDFYREKIPVDTAKLEYFQAFKCLIMMVHFERARREMGIEVFHAPGILESIIELFKNITGIEPIPG